MRIDYCRILSAIGVSNEVNVQWILAHIGLEGNAAADQEAKRGSMLPQSYGPYLATKALRWHQRSIAEDRYLSDPHATVHRAFTGSQHCYQRWQRDWSRDQCITLAAAYLHRIGRQDSAICPHCQGAEETIDQARRDMWFGDFFTRDPRRLWSYLEWIGVLTCSSDRK